MPARRVYSVVRIFLLFLIASAIFLFLPEVVLASDSVLLNEIYIGSSTGSHQWVELYNPTGGEIDLSGWIIDDSGSSTKFYQIDQGAEIGAGAFRSFQSGNFSFNSSTADSVILKNSDGEVDRHDYSSSPGESATLCRYPDGSSSWLICELTRDGNNIPGENPPTSTPTLTPSPTPIASPTIAQASCPSGIILSEFMPDPNEGNEWVEIKNTLSSEVTLSGWKIDDVADGGSSSQSFSAAIPAGGYYKMEISGWLLNNSGDEVRLLCPDDSLVDKTSYSYSNKGVSWIKTDNTWCEAENSTPGGANSSCRSDLDGDSSPTSTPTPTKTPTPASISTSTPSSKTTGITETPSPGEVLGEKEFYPLEATEEGEENQETTSAGGKRKVLPFVFLGLGFVFLFGAGFYFWYTQLR